MLDSGGSPGRGLAQPPESTPLTGRLELLKETAARWISVTGGGAGPTDCAQQAPRGSARA